MPSTYTLISSNVLTSSAASLTFSAIPSTYTDLVMTVSSRSSNTYPGDNPIQMYFNGINTGTSYSATALLNQYPPISQRQSNQPQWTYTGATDTAGLTASTFSTNEYYIPSYTASQNKPISVIQAPEDNSSGTGVLYYQGAVAGLWRNTAAITSITLLANTYDFLTGSSFYLYGIKNS